MSIRAATAAVAALCLLALAPGCQSSPPRQKTPLERALDALEADGVKTYEEGRYDRSARLFRECEDLARSTDNLMALANAYNNQAAVNLAMGNTAEARTTLESAAALNSKLGLDRALAINWANLATLELDTGTGATARAREYNKKAREVFDNLDDAEGLILTANNEARILGREGRSEEARRTLENALEDARSAGAGRLEAAVLFNLGAMAEEARDYETALAFYSDAMSLHRNLEVFSGVAKDLESVARIHASAGDRAKALESLNRAMDVVLLRVRHEPWIRSVQAEIEKHLKALGKQSQIAALRSKIDSELDRVRKEEERRKKEAVESPVGENQYQ